MIELMLLAALNCAEPIKVDRSGKGFSDRDNQAIVYGQRFCSQFPEHPCLKIIYKLPNDEYTGVCGEESTKA